MRVLRGPGANLPARLADSIDRSEIFHSWDLSEEALSYKRDNTTRFNAYPALSVPLGPEDEIVCPPEHQEFVRSLLADVGAIDVLVVGYSAFDQTVLNLLADAAKEIRSLYVVNADLESAVEVTRRMCAPLRNERGRRECRRRRRAVSTMGAVTGRRVPRVGF
jgi:hypothetical protein